MEDFSKLKSGLKIELDSQRGLQLAQWYFCLPPPMFFKLSAWGINCVGV